MDRSTQSLTTAPGGGVCSFFRSQVSVYNEIEISDPASELLWIQFDSDVHRFCCILYLPTVVRERADQVGVESITTKMGYRVWHARGGLHSCIKKTMLRHIIQTTPVSFLIGR